MQRQRHGSGVDDIVLLVGGRFCPAFRCLLMMMMMDPNTSWGRSWCGRQHKLVGTEIIVSSPMQPKPPDGIRMCVLLLRVHLVR